jgi:hypothetical protein
LGTLLALVADAAATTVDVADHVAEVGRFGDHFQLHDRLEQLRLGQRCASRKQARPAISKASAEESTSWYLPSIRRALKSSTS